MDIKEELALRLCYMDGGYYPDLLEHFTNVTNMFDNKDHYRDRAEELLSKVRECLEGVKLPNTGLSHQDRNGETYAYYYHKGQKDTMQVILKALGKD